MKSTVWFKDGPCKGTERPITYPSHPPATLVCKGTTYTILAVPDSRFIVYVVAGGPEDKAGTQLVGARDVFRAWSALHHAWNQTTRRELERTRKAGHRVRRAVR